SAEARGEARTGARQDGTDGGNGSRRNGKDAPISDHDDPELATATTRTLNPGALVDVRA
ncbi:MAG: hypothetical protein JHC95_19740, partial [Solirubrobacteraceae bacterium]|nr:hypothetical protein [Solirubrobacteraceae bacterium]